MKLYNLKECFELSGKKFPFTVIWHSKNSSTNEVTLFRRTFFAETDDKAGSKTKMDNNNETWHQWDGKQFYDASTIIYRKDFDDLINKE